MLLHWLDQIILNRRSNHLWLLDCDPTWLLKLHIYMNCIGHTIIKLTYLKMKNQNNNHFRCKSILFYLFIATLIAAIVMVTYFKDIFYYFACLSMIYALSKYLQMIFIMVHVNKKYSQAMHSFRERQAVRYSCGKEVSHIFVLPNYNEE